jgi:hypothetical protein
LVPSWIRAAETIGPRHLFVNEMGITGTLFNVAGPLIGNSAAGVYNNVQTFEAGGVPETSPLTYNPFAEIFTAGEAGVEALPDVVTEGIDVAIEIADGIETVIEDAAHAVERVAKDLFHGFDWLLEHPFLVIAGTVVAVGGIAYLASNKTNINVSNK